MRIDKAFLASALLVAATSSARADEGGRDGGAPDLAPPPSGHEMLRPEGGVPAHPGLLGEVAQAHGDQSARPAAPSQSIEESFAKHLVLQGKSEQLRQFGYDFFAQPLPATAAADAPVPSDYVLGPGDSLLLHVWNVSDADFNRSHVLSVGRDGTVQVPRAGSIPVAGIDFTHATQIIEARLRKFLRHFDMHLSMAQVRTMRVFVVGEVVRPGAYELSALGTVSQALSAAAGPSRSGSLRKLRVLRGGKPVAELDLYRFLLQGDRTQDLALKPGDTVLVPPIGPVVAITGPVRRPAIYELGGAMKLSELVELAGGLQPSADRKRCEILRLEPGKGRVALEIKGPLGNGNDPVVQDGDLVRVPGTSTLLESTVSIQGAVRNPGAFPFRAGMRLSDLLTADQLHTDSFLERAELVRVDPVTYESRVIEFDPRAVLRGDGQANLVLQRLDKVIVGSQARAPKAVTVSGEVRRPGRYVLASGERLSSLLRRVGGFTERAFPKGIVVIRESVRRAQQEETDRYTALQRQQVVAESASVTAGSSGLEREVASTEQAALRAQLASLDESARRVQAGRVVIEVESIEKLAGGHEDLVLEAEDQIAVPERPQTVSVLGAVRNPASFAFYDKLSASDYIRMAGGPTQFGRVGDAYVLRSSGSAKLSLRHLGIGDTIVVPEYIKPKTRTLPLVVSLASIFASLATTAAALVILSR